MSIPPRTRGETKVRGKRSFVSRELHLPAQAYIHNEVISGITLFGAAFLALVWANSPWSESYFQLMDSKITVRVWDVSISKTLKHWINDGAMVLFFFVVALEVKREFVHGELSTRSQAALPCVAALGGMVLPVLIFLILNLSTPGQVLRGWGIPMATDIAFALGILALLGHRIPAEVRIFLLALATIDDVGAILVIAVFYTDHLSWVMLTVAGLLLVGLGLMRWLGVRNVVLFVFIGVLFWLAVLKSGVHATIAGVALGLLTPAESWFSHEQFAESAENLLERYREALARTDDGSARALLGQIEELTVGTESLVERLERLVHPWVGFLVLPLFALANTGVTFSLPMLEDAVSSSVTIGIVLGLFGGKVMGIVGFSWIGVRTGHMTMSGKMTWPYLIGVGILCGIGFTVSLFIANLAYSENTLIQNAKFGIFIASMVSGLVGYIYLRIMTKAH